MKIQIKIEKQDLGFAPKSVKALLHKLEQVRSVKKGDKLEVVLDFTKEEANELSTAIIWKILNEARAIDCDKNIKYKGGATQKYFNERHFFDRLTGERTFLYTPNRVPINYETFNPTRPTQNNSQNDEINKIFAESTKGILDNSKEFEKEIRIHMVECVQNAFDHSESKGIKPAGIICSLGEERKGKPRILDFCVIDTGSGIKRSFLSNPSLRSIYLAMGDSEVIVESTKENISCNPFNFPNPAYNSTNGGIGLYYLNEFIQMHPGCSMVIISNKGYYYTGYLERQKKCATLTTEWPGTIVYFRIELGQSKSDAYKALCDAYVDEFDNTVL